jgi:virulence-associated protein VapD
LDVTNLKELNILVDEYNKNHEDKVELLEHLHYRELKGKLYLNEILIYKS